MLIWCRLAASPLVTLEGHQKGVMSLSWSKQDPDLLLSAGRDGRVLCWNPNNTKPVSYRHRHISHSATVFLLNDVILKIALNLYILGPGWRAANRDQSAAAVGVRCVVVSAGPQPHGHRVLRPASRRALAARRLQA